MVLCVDVCCRVLLSDVVCRCIVPCGVGGCFMLYHGVVLCALPCVVVCCGVPMCDVVCWCVSVCVDE